MKKCPTCAVVMKDKTKKQRARVFCSRPCFYKSGTRPGRKTGRTKNCAECGGEFYATKARADKKFCSKQCMTQGMTVYEREVKECPTCGEEFTQTNCIRTYCSARCHYESGAPKPGKRTGRYVNCCVCGEEFYAKKQRLEAKSLTCSLECCSVHARRKKKERTCKVCKVKFWTSPSVKRKYCSLKCRDASPKVKRHLLDMNQKQQEAKGPNKFEVEAYEMLDGLEIRYEAQHLFKGKFCVDAFVPKRKLVIQFDGDYWHGNPKLFPKEALDDRQKKRMKLDRSQDKYMEACGYQVVRFFESDFRKRGAWVRKRILAAIKRAL